MTNVIPSTPQPQTAQPAPHQNGSSTNGSQHNGGALLVSESEDEELDELFPELAYDDRSDDEPALDRSATRRDQVGGVRRG